MELGKIKKEAKERLSFATVGKVYRIVRNVAGSASAILYIVAKLPVDFTSSNEAWLTGIASILGVVALGSHLDKSKIINK